MSKFIVTGYTRSGTTYLASILNSQKTSFCFEFNPLTFRDLKSDIEENYFNSRINSIFINLGMEGPNLRNILDYKTQEKTFINFFHTKHNTLHAGFKKTLLSFKDIKNLIQRGYKVIIIKRNIEDTFKSNIARMDLNMSRVSLHFRNYLEEINYYKLNLPETSFKLVDYENLIEDKKNQLLDISNFVNFEIDQNVDLYHSFNKGRYIFKNNSSFDNKSSLPIFENLQKYINFVEGKFDYSLSLYQIFNKLKKLLR